MMMIKPSDRHGGSRYSYGDIVKREFNSLFPLSTWPWVQKVKVEPDLLLTNIAMASPKSFTCFKTIQRYEIANGVGNRNQPVVLETHPVQCHEIVYSPK